MAGLYAGIDLGGTKMLTTLLDESMEVVAQSKIKTPVITDGDRLVGLMIGEIRVALESIGKASGLKDLAALGVTFPGPVDFSTGYVKDTPNLGVRNFPLRTSLEAQLPCPVILENDVNAGVYGEYTAGVGKGYRHVVGLYPGTGIGGGIIIDGHLYRGASGGAGEIGHMIVQLEGRLCGCGQRGCLEAMASKTAIAKDLVHLAGTGKAPTIFQKAGTDINGIKSGLIKKSIQAGEEDVRQVVEKAAYYLGVGLGNVVNIFNPELVILGGGLIEKLESWIVPVAEATMRSHAMASLAQAVELKIAGLGDDSVSRGVAALAKEAVQR
jgi:glucokinase